MEVRSLKDRSIQARFSGCSRSSETTWLKSLRSLRTLLFSHRDWVSDFPDFECLSGRSPVRGSSLNRSVGTVRRGLLSLLFCLRGGKEQNWEDLQPALELGVLAGP